MSLKRSLQQDQSKCKKRTKERQFVSKKGKGQRNVVKDAPNSTQFLREYRCSQCVDKHAGPLSFVCRNCWLGFSNAIEKVENQMRKTLDDPVETNCVD